MACQPDSLATSDSRRFCAGARSDSEASGSRACGGPATPNARACPETSTRFRFVAHGAVSVGLLRLCAASGYALSPTREAAFRLLSSKSSIELQHIIDAVRRRRHGGRRADTRVRRPPLQGWPVSRRHLDEGSRGVRGFTVERGPSADPLPRVGVRRHLGRDRMRTPLSGGRLCAASPDPKSP